MITDFDLGTQETQRTFTSTICFQDDSQRPKTQRINAQNEVRIKKKKKMHIIQEKYDIYQINEKPKTSHSLR